MKSELQARKARPRAKPYRIRFDRCLYLYVAPTGTKTWQYRYMVGGRASTLTLGHYPAMSLAQARVEAGKWRDRAQQGEDPVRAAREEEARQKAEEARRSRGTLRAVVEEFLALRSITERTRETQRRLVLRYCPHLLDRPVETLTKEELEAAVAGVVSGHYARALAFTLRGALEHAVDEGFCPRNPARLLPSKAPRPPLVSHLPATLDPEEIGKILRLLDNYWGHPSIHTVLRVAPYVARRPNELVRMRWDEIVDGVWTFPVAKRRAYKLSLPLPKQVLALIESLRPLNAPSPWVFKSRRGNIPIAAASLRGGMMLAGVPSNTLCPHGWRAVFRTLAETRLGLHPRVLEQILGHTAGGPVLAAYRREDLAEIGAALQAWADYIDSLREGRP